VKPRRIVFLYDDDPLPRCSIIVRSNLVRTSLWFQGLANVLAYVVWFCRFDSHRKLHLPVFVFYSPLLMEVIYTRNATICKIEEAN
jgi:hypothetical protein